MKKPKYTHVLTLFALAMLLPLLMPACSPTEDVTLPSGGTGDITVTTPPKPRFEGDGVNTRFIQETGTWEIGDKAVIILQTMNANIERKTGEFPITCVEVNTDGTATWKFDNFSTNGLYERLRSYEFAYYSPDRYGTTSDIVYCGYTFQQETELASFIANGCNLSLTEIKHTNSRFRLTGLQQGDYVMIKETDFYLPYDQPSQSIINNIRFIAKDNEDTDIYVWIYKDEPVTITVARKGATLSKTLKFNSTEGVSYTIDVSKFKAFDGENPQDVTWIHDASELQAFANAVTNGNTYAGKIVRLACDIDCSGVGNFPVIGEYPKVFSGTFDGNGYSIKGVKMSDNEDTALFYYIGANGIVKNLIVEIISMTGKAYVAGFAYFNHGTIDHCAVVGGTLSTTGEDDDVVGFVYQNTNKITYSTVSATLLLGKTAIGFCSGNVGTIERCGVKSGTVLSGRFNDGFVTINGGGNYIINCYTDAKLRDSTTPGFCYEHSDGIIHCRQGNDKVNYGDWGVDTGFYKTDGPDKKLRLFWE